MRVFFLEAYHIPSPAMRPTLEPGDILFSWKPAYGLWGKPALPKRGDVLIFGAEAEGGTDFIKRAVALPGEKVQIKEGRLWINDKALDQAPQSESSNCNEERYSDGTHFNVCFQSPLLDNFGPETVPQNSVFVLGDLRSNLLGDISKQTANPAQGWGMVRLDSIKGKALWVWLSFNQTGGTKLRLERMFKRIQ